MKGKYPTLVLVITVCAVLLSGCGRKPLMMPKDRGQSRGIYLMAGGTAAHHKIVLIRSLFPFQGDLVVDAETGTSRRVAIPQICDELRTSPDMRQIALGTTLATVGQPNGYSLLVFSTDQATTRGVARTSPHVTQGMIWSPRGDRIACWLVSQQDIYRGIDAYVASLQKRPVAYPTARPIPVVIDVNTGAVRKIPVVSYPLCWSRTGEAVYLQTGRGIVAYDLQTGNVRPVSKRWQVRTAFYSPALHSYVAVVSTKTTQMIERVTPSFGRTRELGSVPLHSLLLASPGGSRIAYAKGGGFRILDLKTGDERRIVGINGHPRLTWLDENTLVFGRADGCFAVVGMDGYIRRIMVVKPMRKAAEEIGQSHKEQNQP